MWYTFPEILIAGTPLVVGNCAWLRPTEAKETLELKSCAFFLKILALEDCPNKISLTNGGGGCIGLSFMAPWLQQVLYMPFAVRSASQNCASQNLHFWSIAPQKCSWISFSSNKSIEIRAMFQEPFRCCCCCLLLDSAREAAADSFSWRICSAVDCSICRLLCSALEAAAVSFRWLICS